MDQIGKALDKAVDEFKAMGREDKQAQREKQNFFVFACDGLAPMSN